MLRAPSSLAGRVPLRPLCLRGDSSESEVRSMFQAAGERLVVRGHNHICAAYSLLDLAIVNCGSVGMPLDGNTDARYLMLERAADTWSWKHRSVPYDVDSTVRRFREDGYLEAAGPMRRLLLREIATASHQSGSPP